MERLPDAVRMRVSRKDPSDEDSGERGLYGNVEADQGRTLAMCTNDAPLSSRRK